MEIAFIGILTFPRTPKAHLRSFGIGTLVFALISELYFTFTTQISVSPDERGYYSPLYRVSPLRCVCFQLSLTLSLVARILDPGTPQSLPGTPIGAPPAPRPFHRQPSHYFVASTPPRPAAPISTSRGTPPIYTRDTRRPPHTPPPSLVYSRSHHAHPGNSRARSPVVVH